MSVGGLLLRRSALLPARMRRARIRLAQLARSQAGRPASCELRSAVGAFAICTLAQTHRLDSARLTSAPAPEDQEQRALWQAARCRLRNRPTRSQQEEGGICKPSKGGSLSKKEVENSCTMLKQAATESDRRGESLSSPAPQEGRAKPRGPPDMCERLSERLFGEWQCGVDKPLPLCRSRRHNATLAPRARQAARTKPPQQAPAQHTQPPSAAGSSSSLALLLAPLLALGLIAQLQREADGAKLADIYWNSSNPM